MSKWGIAFAVLVTIAAFLAGDYTAKVVTYRNSYTAKNVALKAKTAKLQEDIERLEAEIESKNNQVFRARELWGEAWNSVPTNVRQQDGTIEIGAGTKQLIREKMVLHGFQLGEGTSLYQGSFIVVSANEAGAVLKPNWRALPEDISTWKPGPWRWRNEIPSGYADSIDNQLLSIVKQTEVLATRRRDVDGQQVLLGAAQEALKKREAALVGGDGLPKGDKVTAEYRDGLVVTVEQTEEERNSTLRKIDELRRKIRNIEADILQLQSENTDLAQRLPEPTPRSQVTQNK